MGTILERLIKIDEKFNNILPNGILYNLIMQIEQQLDVQTNPPTSYTFDILNDSKTLDDLLLIARIVGANIDTPYIVGFRDNKIVIPDFVKLTQIAPIPTLADALIQVYGSAEAVPNKLTLVSKDYGLVVEVPIDIEQLVINGTRSAIFPGTIISIFTTDIPSMEQLVPDDTRLSDVVYQETNKDFEWLATTDKKSVVLTSIQSRFQQINGSTTTQIYNIQLNKLYGSASHIVIKNLARGIGTIDVVIFPKAVYQLDQLSMLVTVTQPLAHIVRDDIINSVPIGIDVDVRDQKPQWIDITIKGYAQNEGLQKRLIATELSQTLFEKQLGMRHTITKSQIEYIILSMQEQSADRDYQFTVADQSQIVINVNGVELTDEYEVKYDEYPAVRTITFIE